MISNKGAPLHTVKHLTPGCYRWIVVTTVVSGLLIVFFGLGEMKLLSLNEGRRALAIKEMYLSGDWMLPRQNGELYLAKPPLLYWLATGASHLFGGLNEWTLRLPSAFAAVAVIVMVFQYARTHFGRWAALFAAQLLIANVGFAMTARRVEIEMLLTALCLGALMATMKYVQQGGRRHWIYVSYFLLGLAVLTKGPVALLFVTLPLLVAALWTRSDRLVEVLKSKLGWCLLLLTGLSWYALVTATLGTDIWAEIARKDLLEKMQGEQGTKPILSYLGWIATDFLLLVGMFLVKSRALYAVYRGRPDFIVPLVAAVVPLIVFSLFSNKHAKYLLPIYPLIAILLAVQLTRIFEEKGRRTRVAMLAIGLVLPLIFAAYYAFAESRIFDYRVSAFPKFQDWSSSVRESSLYAYGNIDARLIYYSSKPVKEVSPEQFQELRASESSMVLLIAQEDLERLRPDASCTLKEFDPYLKKGRKLIALGLGAACK